MKLIKQILILLILVNIGLLVYLVITPKIETYDYTSYVVAQEDIKRQKGELDESNYIKPVRNDIISFENEGILLAGYVGELLTGNVNIKFTELLDTGFKKLYSDTKQMNRTELANYLEENIKDISMQTGITDIEDFTKFIQKIQIYQDENIKCEKAEIVQGSYVNGNDYDNFKVQLSYDNGQSIVFTVSLSNRDFMDTPLIIIR